MFLYFYLAQRREESPYKYETHAEAEKSIFDNNERIHSSIQYCTLSDLNTNITLMRQCDKLCVYYLDRGPLAILAWKEELHYQMF